MIKVISILFLLAGQSNAASLGDQSRELAVLKDKLSERKKVIASLNGRITAIERNINNNNKKYLSMIQRRNSLEEQLYAFQVEISLLEEKLRISHDKAKVLLRQILVNSLGKKHEIEDLLENKILENKARDRIALMQKQFGEIGNLQSKLKLTKERFDFHNKGEKNVLEALDRLEEQKRLTARDFVSNLKNRDKLESKYNKLKKNYAKIRKNYKKEQKISMEFFPPLPAYDS
ncbi:MAG: hypothetical protein OXB84_05525, partial [Halobacteriovoraceae bacterium]|nr:hypothetical protein [Halobacteriovoraceae bacterium]